MLACIAVIITGVTVSTTNSATFNTTSVILAAITNLCFSVRSVLVKTIQAERAASFQRLENLDEDDENRSKKQSDESKYNVFDIFGCCCIFGFFFVSLTSITYFIFPSSREIDFAAFITNPNVIITSISYFTFNLFSFLVLGFVTSADHSLLKIGKRTCVLVGAKVLLHEAMTKSMWFGVCLTLAGLVAYNLAKSKTGFEGTRKRELIAIIALLVVGVVPLLHGTVRMVPSGGNITMVASKYRLGQELGVLEPRINEILDNQQNPHNQCWASDNFCGQILI